MDGNMSNLAFAALVIGIIFLWEFAGPLVRWISGRLRKEPTTTESAPEALNPVPVGGNVAAVQCPQSSVREKTAEGQGTKDCGQTQGTLDSGRTEALAEAGRLWEEARGMAHCFAPDEIKDGEYLRKIQMAAELGHVEAMAKLGTYAFRNSRYVEAFYWRWRAEANGWRETEKPTLREIRLQWMGLGCRAEHGLEESGNIDSDQASFARAVLRLQCGINSPGARQRLKELADCGSKDAKLFLGQSRLKN